MLEQPGLEEYRLDHAAGVPSQGNLDRFPLEDTQVHGGVLPVDVGRDEHTLPDVERKAAGEVDPRKDILGSWRHGHGIAPRVIEGQVPARVDLDRIMSMIVALVDDPDVPPAEELLHVEPGLGGVVDVEDSGEERGGTNRALEPIAPPAIGPFDADNTQGGRAGPDRAVLDGVDEFLARSEGDHHVGGRRQFLPDGIRD
ncbi:MAG: hypothetical protein FD129_3193, partial [bacterium]